MGTALQAGKSTTRSLRAQQRAGAPISVSSDTVNKVCASRMRPVSMLDTPIRTGDNEAGLTDRMESMSYTPCLLARARFALRLGDETVRDAMLSDGLESPGAESTWPRR
jgi:acetyl-CoA C-acetyltransferase